MRQGWSDYSKSLKTWAVRRLSHLCALQQRNEKGPPDDRRAFIQDEILFGRGLEPFALQTLALHLARTADGFSGFPRPTLRRLLEMATQLHLAEDSFPLHLFLKRFERLINIVVTNENLHWVACSISLDCYRRSGSRSLLRVSDQAGAIP
jgi:hypothetical protein